jgi:hypothetical protein
MTTITLRFTKGAFLVTGKDIEARTFASRREAKDWCAGTLSERGCSTAGRDAPVDDHALPVGRFLDGYQSEAFREPDGGTRLGPSDVGALSDPCHRE